MISIVAVHPPSPGAPESSEGEVEGRGREIDRDTCDTMEAMPEASDTMKRLGAQLRTARRTADLTQAQAAELAGVTRGRWAQMEAGSVSNLNRLLAACEVIGAELEVNVRVPSEE